MNSFITFRDNSFDSLKLRIERITPHEYKFTATEESVCLKTYDLVILIFENYLH